MLRGAYGADGIHAWSLACVIHATLAATLPDGACAAPFHAQS
jgi:hypothetical protein